VLNAGFHYLEVKCAGCQTPLDGRSVDHTTPQGNADLAA
jgi:hypothetical protein